MSMFYNKPSEAGSSYGGRGGGPIFVNINQQKKNFVIATL